MTMLEADPPVLAAATLLTPVPAPVSRGPSHAPHAVDPLALSLNENPFPPLAAVRAAIVASIGAANRYPEFYPQRLRSLIADHIGADAGQVVIGAGATGVMLQVLHALTSPGDEVVFASPTFDGYPIVARMTRLTQVPVPLDANGYHDLDAMADAAATARVVVVCRPHNPTGTVESAFAIERFLQRIPRDTVVLVDEAYAEFLEPEYGIDWVATMRRHPNVVVARTFSKAYGLAGLRIGYGFTSPELAEILWSMQLPFGVSHTSMVAVAASYRAEAQLRRRIRLITVERTALRHRLLSLGIRSMDSHANFIYLPPAELAWTDVFDGNRLRVRHYSDGAARITIGSRRSTKAVLDALHQIPNGAA